MYPSSLTRLAVAVLLVTGAARADWLQFRGPNGNGSIAGNERVPTELGDDTIAWRVPLPGRGLGSPIVAGDRIFLTAAEGPDQERLLVLCLDGKDGKEWWRRSFRATGRTMCHEKTCVAAPTPVSDGKRLYALWSSNDLVCLDFEGNLIWLRGLTLDYPNASNSIGMASSPVIVGDTLVAQIENDSESFAVGLDLETGANKWRMDRPKAANWTSPLVLNTRGLQTVALQSSKGVLGVSAETGSPIWSYDRGASTISSGAAAGDTLYVPSNGLAALRPGTKGEPVDPLWNEKSQRPFTVSPLVLGGRLYFTNSAGVLTATDCATGERLWRMRVKGPVSASPVAPDNGHLYLFNEGGVGQVIDISGEEGEVVSEIELGATILGTPSISDHALYVRSDAYLWKFGPPAD